MNPTPSTPDMLSQVRALAESVEALDAAVRDRAAVEALDALESLKNACAGAQTRLAMALRSARVEQRADEPARMRTRGIGHEIAMARRESPHRGKLHLGLAAIVCAELPYTLAAMEAGWCSEWRALQLVQGTACLTLADRQAIDEQLMSYPATTSGWGDQRFRGEVDKLAYAADPKAAVEKIRAAAGERHTSLRPAPDGMARFSALLPLAQGVQVHATLLRAADSARAAGDDRTRGQVMCDTLVDAIKARPEPEKGVAPTPEQVAPADPAAPIAVQVTVSDATLLNVPGEAGDQPGWISAPGVAAIPLPADIVRDLVARASAEGLATLRRLYVSPQSGQLVAMDSQARRFPAGLAAFLIARDRTCTTPYCDAPVRHLDHLVPHAQGGATDVENGNGRCVACNQAKEATGWRGEVTPGPHREIQTTTPSGHRHRSRPPRLPAPLQPLRRADFFFPLSIAA